jgi:hypothetical protein
MEWIHLAKKRPSASSSDFVIEFSGSIKGCNFWLAAGLLDPEAGLYATKGVKEWFFCWFIYEGCCFYEVPAFGVEVAGFSK